MNTTKRTIHTSMQTIASLSERFRLAGDEERVEKAERLAEKMYEEELILAFCGHFSAGKSSMINHLIGDSVLPASPIPTSANLVKVKKTDSDYAMIYYQHQHPVYIPSPYDEDKVREWCKDRDVYSVEIGRSDMDKHVSILDTPGVDSTDDAHRLSTESALHLADAVFYVMDYNHVQSQVNFEFTRELSLHGVKQYLVINQIDKHNEREISFGDFKTAVKDAFQSWGVEPEGIFYTSLRKPDMEGNDLPELEALVERQVTDRQSLIEESLQASLSQLIQEHDEWYKTKLDHLKEESGLEDKEWEDMDRAFTLEKELLDRLLARTGIRNTFEEERADILKNAYLMPFETRELAERFLESRQKGFKVGFLFTGQKTEEEKKLRLEAFLSDLNGRIDSQLQWHIRTLGKKIVKSAGLSGQFIERWDELSLEVDSAFITDVIREGAGLNGDYVLQYCNELAEEIKKRCRLETNDLMTEMTEEVNTAFTDENERMEEELRTVQEKTAVFLKWNQIEEERLEQATRIREGTRDSTVLEGIVSSWLKKWDIRHTHYRSQEDLEKPSATTREEIHAEAPEIAKESPDRITREEAARKLTVLEEVFTNYEGFRRTAGYLRGKRERISNQSFTIALFGAFSAGKSSFANALLGRSVLPVSPNPTTASINRICPVSDHHVHETADIHFKSPQQMLGDLNHSLSHFGEKADSLESVYSLIPSILQSKDRENVHRSFLSAFHSGYEKLAADLGSVKQVPIDEYRTYVANESRSCFVESIDLYYDCPLTRQGITLVDTPGADSINARHTGVAFEYIKNADAVLFVTYYNHAFAKADREFLIQLGRVKDSFELDKMFFIVNAIDLAANKEEKDEVLGYVESQLLQYGIRFPRIYGVSSLQAMEEKAASGIIPFREAFHSFIEEELVQMSIDAAIHEWERGYNRFRQWVEFASTDQASKESRREQLMETKEGVLRMLNAETPAPLLTEMRQELSELLHYVKQRVFYRLPDFFKEAFHPGKFPSSGNPGEAISAGAEELKQSISYDFTQEMRATSLRIEQFIDRALKGKMEELERRIKAMESELYLAQPDFDDRPTIEFTEGLQEADVKSAFHSFKNAKYFFEGGGKKEIQERVEKSLSSPADAYLSTEETRLSTWAESLLERDHEKLMVDSKEQLSEQLDALINVTTQVMDLESLASDLARLEDVKNAKA
ncbi:dynamin family protein [Rossellomorea marisflavi]|uniref:dynamin family protein n=1 Tax=Rossellomorea marisflavi TaxID=189381 RepID=UPI00296E88F9|nr:dynamin family protein [Rossellomorea marisflavi]MDW4527097.1 dynamin family protein [Rossellomorea marisflavi]